jgi:DNA-directed RNA polymerase subunit RPC12/RpoP
MFLTNCTECGRRELRGARSIEILVNTDQGIDLVYRCTRCGVSNVLGASQAPADRPLVAA